MRFCTAAGGTVSGQEDNTVQNLLLFLQKPSLNKSFPKSLKHLEIAALYLLAINQYQYSVA